MAKTSANRLKLCGSVPKDWEIDTESTKPTQPPSKISKHDFCQCFYPSDAGCITYLKGVF